MGQGLPGWEYRDISRRHQSAQGLGEIIGLATGCRDNYEPPATAKWRRGSKLGQ